MTIETAFQGSLFTSDFLTSAIAKNSDWQTYSDKDVEEFASRLRGIFGAFPTTKTPDEARTEDDLIWPVLKELGWTHFMRQQNLSEKGRDDVPDGLLFGDEAAKRLADTHVKSVQKYQHGLAIVESKRWNRPLDRRAGKGEELAPSTQMLRYLRQLDIHTSGSVRWGILTNGARWRLYFSGARSVSEQFLEIDLTSLLGIGAHANDLFQLSPENKLHMLRVFMLVFRREAFLPTPPALQTFHTRAMDEGKVYEERVANDLSNLVFSSVYPLLARAIADRAPQASLDHVREAALILLYRLLFILYAEDRDLLPVNDKRYDDYGLRKKVRQEIGTRKDANDSFSTKATRYWSVLDSLCLAIDEGDTSIGLPPYNGGLFDAKRTPLLREVQIPDDIMAEVIDRLSFERSGATRKYINYRDLSVQQLGSIYERLLEHEVVREGELVDIRPNIFARKGSGSYYTPDDLVQLIISETLDPLIERHVDAFRKKAEELATSDLDEARRIGALKRLDPATALLDLKICDPAMGSGHFLVSLVDYMADRVQGVLADSIVMVEWAEYLSPLSDRIDEIRNTILANAEQENWTVDIEQLDDRHIIRRMILKCCIYGVDKNPMAVELAKVALWLHSFTVGAPLSFLDHHLRCGDSLFGSWVLKGKEETLSFNDNPLFLVQPMKDAIASAASMQQIERLPDAEIAEAHRSAEIFEGVQSMTAPLNSFLSFIHALHWIDTKSPARRAGIRFFIDGVYGDPFMVLAGRHKIKPVAEKATEQTSKKKTLTASEIYHAFQEVLTEAQAIINEERFLNWQVTFPGVWTDWLNEELVGGFDAIIGNPPWAKVKLEQVKWFEVRRQEIALAKHAADRKKMVEALESANDPLAVDFRKASARAEAAAAVARSNGDYPLLSGGDINLYSLFVERAMKLVRRDGMVGLLTPSGIASDATAAKFFKGVATEGRLKALYDFENRRTKFGGKPFFPDVDSRFKFCAFIASPAPLSEPSQCAFFLQDVSELSDAERRFPLRAADFARVNPNTSTAPIFRTRRDAALVAEVYSNAPVFVDRSSGREIKTWPLKYANMYHMSGDSDKFRTLEELEISEKAWGVGGNHYQNAEGRWLPLYEGKMLQAYNHRAATIVVNAANVDRTGQPLNSTLGQLQDHNFVAPPRYWILDKDVPWKSKNRWSIAFKDVTASTNVRSMIATIIPYSGSGHTVSNLFIETDASQIAPLVIANLNSIPFDYCARVKTQTNHLSWYILEQIPVIPPERFEEVGFGQKSASEIVKEAVLELTYTSHDMAPFALDMGYFDADGNVRPPFTWDEDRRLRLRAKLDAVFFHLYGITDRDDVRYIYSTFPIVERQETEAHGRYLSRDLCLAYINALSAGQPDAEPMV